MTDEPVICPNGHPVHTRLFEISPDSEVTVRNCRVGCPVCGEYAIIPAGVYRGNIRIRGNTDV